LTAPTSNIYLEDGNETWNFSPGADYNLEVGNGTVYGQLLGANVAAFKASPYYASNMKIVGSGWFGFPSTGWTDNVLTASCGISCPDNIDIATYVNAFMTDISSNATYFGSMFAEPVNNNTLTSGNTYVAQNNAYTNYGVDAAVYESNVSAQAVINGITQAQIDNFGAGVGTGLDETLNLLTAARDSGIKVQNVFTLPGGAAPIYTSPSVTSGTYSISGTLYAPIWSTNLYMTGPGASGTIDRPTEIATAMVNQAIGSKLNLLNTVQTGTPTYNQPSAQPNPNNGGKNSIAANKAVPYVQAFGFGDGAGNYSLIVYNLDLTKTRAITFSGAGAPTGTCMRTTFTSTHITDNNEGARIGSTPTVKQPIPASYAGCASGDILPPFSMVTYVYHR
jgi:hypothetical protein